MMTFNPQEHMISLKGKSYLQVMWRLVWFREVHSDWTLITEMIAHVPGESAVFCARIEDADGRCLSTGHGSETRQDFRDYLEKAETKAVGRALAMLGFGTQFSPDLDEGDRIVDSPVAKPAERITPEQAFDLQKAVEEVGDLDRFLQAYNIPNMASMTVDQYPHALAQVEKKRNAE